MNRNKVKKSEGAATIKSRMLITALVALFLTAFVAESGLAQEKKQVRERVRIQQFVDEDGDGFNDLLPDSDGDGIPDDIDPDFKGHSAESLYMHRYMNGQTIEAERHQFQHENHFGEPGQYGPNDSTGHGQGDGRGDHHGDGDQGNQGDDDGGQNGQGGDDGQGGQGEGDGSGGHGGDGNQGEGGGGQGEGEGGGNQGGGPGLNSPNSGRDANASLSRQGNSDNNQNRKPERGGKGANGHGGNGGH